MPGQVTRGDALLRVILYSEIGSRAHGLNLDTSDSDRMGVCIEPIASAMGSSAPFEQFVEHDSEGDLTIYSLRKFVRLALKGNPTVLTLFFTPLDVGHNGATPVGQELRDKVDLFLSKHAGRAHLGYLQAQRQRMLGERGNGGHGSPRSALTEQFGYDTKYAMHMLRLGIQGVELLRTGRIAIPMAAPDREFLMAVRTGRRSQQLVLTQAGMYEEELRDLLDTSPLPDEPDVAAIDRWLTHNYLRTWREDAYRDEPATELPFKGERFTFNCR